MFTDGVAEARSGDEEFGEERPMTLLQCDRSAKPGEVLSCRRLG
jgi:serine phosphatase RsbU (regulator of sigma subunit)